MDGMLLLEGYKLKQAVYLNLQKHTIFITHSDYYTPVVMFDLLERYFGKKDFSEKYLVKSKILCKIIGTIFNGLTS